MSITRAPPLRLPKVPLALGSSGPTGILLGRAPLHPGAPTPFDSRSACDLPGARKEGDWFDFERVGKALDHGERR